MIRVRMVQRDGHTFIECKGHGSDTVCAGVGAIMGTAMLGLHQIAKERPRSLKVIKGRK